MRRMLAGLHPTWGSWGVGDRRVLVGSVWLSGEARLVSLLLGRQLHGEIGITKRDRGGRNGRVRGDAARASSCGCLITRKVGAEDGRVE